MTMRASLIIEARDRASAVFGRIGSRARQMGNSFRPVTNAATGAARAIDRIGQGAAARFMAIGRSAVSAASSMRVAERAAYGAGRAIGGAARIAGQWALGAAQWAALGAGAGMGGFVAGVIRTSSEFEQFQIRLENTEGSAAKARQAMSWVQDFAQRTPYELDQVMQAFVSLRAYGIDPTDGSLQVLGDTAAGMGKPIMQAVEMMADAMTGEFERLKEFGVRARAEGDNVTFSYQRNGETLTRTVRNNATEIQRGLNSILGDRFSGMMTRQSQTLAGIWSNIKDQATKFMLAVGQAGIFDRLKARADEFLKRISGADGSPRLQQWAKRMSDQMGVLVDRAFDFVENTDWMAVANGVAAITGALITVVGWIGKAASAWSSWQRDVERRQLQSTANGWFNSEADRAAARRRLEDMDQEDAIAAGRRPRYRADQYPIGMPVPRDALPARNTGRPLGGGRPWWGSPAAGSMLTRPQARPRFREPWLDRTSRAAPTTRVGGSVDVRISAAPGLLASTARVASANPQVPVRVASRGPVRPAS